MACSLCDVLLDWFRQHGRDLPWRHTRDPYAIWLSEIILQQTRIEQGTSYWLRLMQRFPRVELLAAATEDEVLRLWQGLGYYSRARNLHAAAKQIVERGNFPNTYDEIKQLKGVGDYTAAAIGSFAFSLPVAVVDGNVYRVLARYFGIDTPINTTEGKKLFALLAQEQLSLSQPADYNQAIMDFGALQCTPAAPRCMACPLMESCTAFRTNRVGELPVKLKTVKVKTRRMTYVYLRCDGETVLRRRPAGDIWQGLWEPFLIEGAEVHGCEGTEVRGFEGAEVLRNGVLTQLRQGVKHVLTHRILLADFYLFECKQKPALPAGYQWVAETSLHQYAVPRLVELLFEVVDNL